jgi:hypothetical protein
LTPTTELPLGRLPSAPLPKSDAPDHLTGQLTAPLAVRLTPDPDLGPEWGAGRGDLDLSATGWASPEQFSSGEFLGPAAEQPRGGLPADYSAFAEQTPELLPPPYIPPASIPDFDVPGHLTNLLTAPPLAVPLTPSPDLYLDWDADGDDPESSEGVGAGPGRFSADKYPIPTTEQPRGDLPTDYPLFDEQPFDRLPPLYIPPAPIPDFDVPGHLTGLLTVPPLAVPLTPGLNLDPEWDAGGDDPEPSETGGAGPGKFSDDESLSPTGEQPRELPLPAPIPPATIPDLDVPGRLTDLLTPPPLAASLTPGLDLGPEWGAGGDGSEFGATWEAGPGGFSGDESLSPATEQLPELLPPPYLPPASIPKFDVPDHLTDLLTVPPLAVPLTPGLDLDPE